MATYQDVIRAELPLASWALTEASGSSFAPWIGSGNLVSTGTLLYRQIGPFSTAFGLHLAAGATLRSGTLPYVFGGPTHHEIWFKLDAFPPAANWQIVYIGTITTNGYGLIMLTSGHLAWYFPGTAGIVDSGQGISDTNWHMVNFGTDPTTHINVSLDGNAIFNAPNPGFSAPSPNVLAYGCDGASGAVVPVTLSYPAVFVNPYTPQGAFADFLASTDPTNALALTLTGAATSTSPTLSEILAAVKKTF